MNLEYKTTIAENQSDRFQEKLSKMSEADKIIEDFVRRTPGYSIISDFHSTGHETGKGCESTSVKRVEKDGKSGLVLIVNDSYQTTSDDFFDFQTSPVVTLKVTDKKLKELYDDLVKFYDKLK